MRFVGRKQELSRLKKEYDSNGFAFSVLFGRRRIGKTALLEAFIEGKDAVFYTGLAFTETDNIAGLSRQLNDYLGRTEAAPLHQSYEQIFLEMADVARKKRLVVIIDEFPYLAEASPYLSSLIQRFVDHEWAKTKLHLILCGSSMSFMERQVLGAKSPLYGRRTSQIRLQPFRFHETIAYLDKMDAHDVAVLHEATGGVAEYLSFVDQSLSLQENLYRLFFRTDGRLYEEPANLLLQELRQPKLYNSLLAAMAQGATKLNDIAMRIGLSTPNSLNHYLDNLTDLGIVKRESPIVGKQHRKTLYRIDDGCFRFWYRYVAKYMTAIELGRGETVVNDLVMRDLSNYMGAGFENIAYDVFDLLNTDDAWPDLITARGRWWGNDPELKQEEEIDLIGISDTVTIFAEMKWRNEPCSQKTLSELKRKSQLVESSSPFYVLFCKTGFTSALKNHAAAEENIRLIDFQEIVKIVNKRAPVKILS